MTKSLRSEAGFSLIEVLVATAIMLIVTGGIFTVMNPSSTMFQAQPEVVDLQQRLRIGVDTLTRDLVMAGAGAYSGSLSGSLSGFFAPVQPIIQGTDPALDDSSKGVFYRPDAITLFYVPSTASQTSIYDPMPNTSAELKVNKETNCPQNSHVCDFQIGDSLLIYDDTGAYDTLTVTQIGADSGGNDFAMVQHKQQGDLSKAYGKDAKVVKFQEHVYYYDAPNRKLMHYDGFQTSTPVLDEVVGVNFEYYGDPQPPMLRDGNGLSSQAVTYGPVPPKLGVTKGNWPAGENCTIQLAGGIQQPRLANLGAAGTGLVLLTQGQLTDGPWCPDAANSNRFDADLFRVRKIRVTLRLQTGNPALRGVAGGGLGSLWVQPGTGTGARLVGDQQIRFDVTPRNMNLTR